MPRGVGVHAVDVSMLQGKAESSGGKVMEDASRIECGDSRTAFWLHRKDLARRFRIAAGLIAQTAALFLPRLWPLFPAERGQLNVVRVRSQFDLA